MTEQYQFGTQCQLYFEATVMMVLVVAEYSNNWTHHAVPGLAELK